MTAWATFAPSTEQLGDMRDAGHYEAGLWDVSGGKLAKPRWQRWRSNSLRQSPDPLRCLGVGWWQREARLTYPLTGSHFAARRRPAPTDHWCNRNVRQAFARFCAMRGLPAHLLTRAELDIASQASVDAALDRWNPWAVINTAGSCALTTPNTSRANGART